LRLGLFGGTFDPIHNAHLAIAREAVRVCRLDRLLIVPAAHPPHKVDKKTASYQHRFRMVELACDGQPKLEASRLEAGVGQSYSVNTVERFRTTLSKSDELFFVIGADAFAEIETWFRWRDLISLVDFIVVSRPGHIYAVPEGARVQRLETLSMETSSSDIRLRLALGQTHEELPPAVLAYIEAHHLYRTVSLS
jgi:nicotinate-nucleotide adenylyltransferase